MKIFDRHPSLASASIINYRADAAQKWLVLVGLVPAAAQGATPSGAIQLYSVDKKVSQSIEGHAACFAKYFPTPSSPSTTLFCFAAKSAVQGNKVRNRHIFML